MAQIIGAGFQSIYRADNLNEIGTSNGSSSPSTSGGTGGNWPTLRTAFKAALSSKVEPEVLTRPDCRIEPSRASTQLTMTVPSILPFLAMTG